METWNTLTVTRGEGRGGQWWKEGEGTRQRIYMNDPKTWTTVRELGKWGGVEESKRGKIGATVIE